MQHHLNTEQIFEVGNQKLFRQDVERLTKILRLIHDRTLDKDSEAKVVLEMDSGFMETIDMIKNQSLHSLISIISLAGKVAKPEFAESSRSLFECSGYRITNNKNAWYKEFIMTDNHAYHDLAVLSVGLLSLLFKYKPGDFLPVNLFVPGPDTEKLLPAIEELQATNNYTELEMRSHAEFRADYSDCLANFHTSMCLDAEAMSDAEVIQVKEAINQIENMIQTIPKIFAEIHKPEPAYIEFLYKAENIETELSECLITLRGTFRERLFN